MDQVRLIQLLETIDQHIYFCGWCPAAEFCDQFFTGDKKSETIDCATILGLWLDGN